MTNNIESIRERLAKASPWPWIEDAECQPPMVRSSDGVPLGGCYDNLDDGSLPIDDEQSDRNLHFIAHAPSDIAFLLAQNARLTAEIAKAKSEAWNAAIDAALLTLPGGDSCDPQACADGIRELMQPK